MNDASPTESPEDRVLNPYEVPHADFSIEEVEPTALTRVQWLKLWAGSTAAFLCFLLCLEAVLLFVAAVVCSFIDLQFDKRMEFAIVAVLPFACFLAWAITRGFHRENARALQEQNRAALTHKR